MKVLCTGATGFLGYHIKKEFALREIDIFTPRAYELNLLDLERINIFLSYHKPDVVLHMAAKCGGILANKNNPASFMRDNTQMAFNIYEAARQNNITNIYSLGSVCSYPANCPTPFKEDDIWNGQPEITNAPYGQAKRTLLMLNQTYRQEYGFTGVHFIPVNLYGENDHFDLINSHVIPALIAKMSTTEPNVFCFGTGTATREFLYAGDAAKAIVGAIANNVDYDLPINLGVGKDISIKDLTYMIKEISEYKGNIIFTGEVSDGQMKRLLDVSRAQEVLGWTASTSLRDGLKKTIDWYRAHNLALAS